MFVRRVLLFFVLLLAVTSLTAGLAPPPAPRSETPSPTPSPGTARSDTVARTLDAGDRRPPTITVRTGDRLTLTVKSPESDAVELRGLAGLRPVAPGTPVIFDVLPSAPGSYPVVLSSEGRTVGTVRVVSRPR